jgi:hypothetical protein
MAAVPDRARQAFRILHVGFVVAPILAGLDKFFEVLVALRPCIGGYIVAVWLWAIIVNLLVAGDHLDIALRDFGLSLGALALAELAEAFPGSGFTALTPASSRQRS